MPASHPEPLQQRRRVAGPAASAGRRCSSLRTCMALSAPRRRSSAWWVLLGFARPVVFGPWSGCVVAGVAWFGMPWSAGHCVAASWSVCGPVLLQRPWRWGMSTGHEEALPAADPGGCLMPWFPPVQAMQLPDNCHRRCTWAGARWRSVWRSLLPRTPAPSPLPTLRSAPARSRRIT